MRRMIVFHFGVGQSRVWVGTRWGEVEERLAARRT
jgi:hypothetical protein